MFHPYSDHNASIRNRLLAALPPKELERLLPNLEEFTLTLNADIYKLGETIHHVYFPVSGIISLVAAVKNGSTLEVGLVGYEGMAGLALFLGVKTSNYKAFVQGSGIALRMNAEDFVRAFKNGGVLSGVLQRFAHSRLAQISQSAVCYRSHRVEKRLARWLLMTSDRMETNEFQMTQEFLSHILGVRREAINHAAALLKKQQLIIGGRGHILIIDRPGLEAAVCECYAVICNEEKSFPVLY